MAFLAHSLVTDLTITEDSDSLVYGCPRVLFKLDPQGNCEEIEHCNLGSNSNPSFANWTQEMFICMAILAGCDYAPHIKGLGISR